MQYNTLRDMEIGVKPKSEFVKKCEDVVSKEFGKNVVDEINKLPEGF